MCEKCGEGQGISSGDRQSQVTEGLPRQPEKFTLQGHRSRITKVAIHPIYTMLATASEDASIKLWDYE